MPPLAVEEVPYEQRGGARLAAVGHRVPRAAQRCAGDRDFDEFAVLQLAWHGVPGRQGRAQARRGAGEGGTAGA